MPLRSTRSMRPAIWALVCRGESQFVERVAGDLGVLVGIEQAVERGVRIVGARCGQFLVARLQTQCGRHRREACVERHQLDLDAAFMLLVGEGLPDAQCSGIGGISKRDLVVLVIGGACPEPNRLDRRGIGPIFALGRDLGLARVDAGAVVGGFDAGDTIQRIVLRDRSTNKSTVEDIRAADRPARCLRGRVGLTAVDRPGLVEQIRIARYVVIAALAAIGVGMHREIAGAGIEQDAALDTAIDRADRRARLRGHAGRRGHIRERSLGGQAIALERCHRAGRQRIGDAVVGRADDAADRRRSITQGRWPADHFDLVGRERVDRNEMILAEIRSAVAADAVFDDADAIDVETPDDRPG